MKKLVVTGSYHEFLFWDLDTDEYQYIRDISELYIYRNTKLLLIGQYWLNPLWDNWTNVLSYCYSHNINIMEWRGNNVALHQDT